jgi:protein-arginine kinase
LMFKDMSADEYLASAGISSSWPHGRGCYVSNDREFIVWVGEEDHLRIMCMKKGTVLNEVFDRLKGACDVVEANASGFAHSKGAFAHCCCFTHGLPHGLPTAMEKLRIVMLVWRGRQKMDP